jgi:hypothetical protein
LAHAKARTVRGNASNQDLAHQPWLRPRHQIEACAALALPAFGAKPGIDNDFNWIQGSPSEVVLQLERTETRV